eukprot:scaffold79575_cov57-Attheya_sp.AAC.4
MLFCQGKENFEPSANALFSGYPWCHVVVVCCAERHLSSCCHRDVVCLCRSCHLKEEQALQDIIRRCVLEGVSDAAVQDDDSLGYAEKVLGH